jgi:hypothetical protein
MTAIWSTLSPVDRLTLARSDPGRVRRLRDEAAVEYLESAAWKLLERVHGQTAAAAAKNALDQAKQEALNHAAGGEGGAS